MPAVYIVLTTLSQLEVQSIHRFAQEVVQVEKVLRSKLESNHGSILVTGILRYRPAKYTSSLSQGYRIRVEPRKWDVVHRSLSKEGDLEIDTVRRVRACVS